MKSLFINLIIHSFNKYSCELTECKVLVDTTDIRERRQQLSPPWNTERCPGVTTYWWYSIFHNIPLLTKNTHCVIPSLTNRRHEKRTCCKNEYTEGMFPPHQLKNLWLNSNTKKKKKGNNTKRTHGLQITQISSYL